MRRLGLAAAAVLVGCVPEPSEAPHDITYYSRRTEGDAVPVQVVVHRDGNAWFIVGTDTNRWDVWRWRDGDWHLEPTTQGGSGR